MRRTADELKTARGLLSFGVDRMMLSRMQTPLKQRHTCGSPVWKVLDRGNGKQTFRSHAVSPLGRSNAFSEHHLA